MDNTTNEWAGWKDIELNSDLIGDTITKGSDTWEKEYTYIKIPEGYGYDNYCFLLSSKCVHISENEKLYLSYFSICHDMKIELIISPEFKENGKRYKRYKLSGRELFNTIFKDYEINFHKEYYERARKEQEEKDKKNKKKMGRCICGKYNGNFSVYDTGNKYMPESCFKAFFQLEDGSRYSNKKFNKVENVKVIFEISSDISKYEFDKWEEIINAYLIEFHKYYLIAENIRNSLDKKTPYSKVEIKTQPHLLIKTDLDDIAEYVLDATEKAMHDVQIRLKNRLNNLKNNNK